MITSRDQNINIPANLEPQVGSGGPESYAAAVQPPAASQAQPKEAKLAFLISSTLVLGLISLACLVFVIRMKQNTPFQPLPQAEPEEAPVITETQKEQAPPADPTSLIPQALLSELDELELEEIGNSYNDSSLEE